MSSQTELLDEPRVDDVDWDSLAPMCEACRAAKKRKYLEDNKEEIAKFVAVWSGCKCYKNRKFLIGDYHNQIECVCPKCDAWGRYLVIQDL